MPLVTVTVLRPKSVQFKDSVLQAIHDALISIGVPGADRFQRVLELSLGRSVKVQKQFLAKLMSGLAVAGHDPENAMVVFKETTWENWAFAGGRQIHV